MKKIFTSFLLAATLVFSVPTLFDTNSPFSIPVAHAAATDVKNDANLSTNLVSYWELEEAAGSDDRVDSHGSNDLTAVNTPGQVTGVQGNAVDFVRASSEYLTITDAAQTGLDFTTDFSVSFWIKPDTSAPAAIVWSKMVVSPAYRMAFETGNTIYAVFWDGSGNATGVHSVGTATDGSWTHVVVLFDDTGNDIRIYLNGTETTYTGEFNNGTGGIRDNSSIVVIGANNSGSDVLDGAMDDFGAWSKLLTSTEISDLYNSGSGIPYDAGGAPATPPPVKDALLFDFSLIAPIRPFVTT